MLWAIPARDTLPLFAPCGEWCYTACAKLFECFEDAELDRKELRTIRRATPTIACKLDMEVQSEALAEGLAEPVQ